MDVKDIIEENKKNNKSEILNSKGENIPYDNLYNSYSYFNSMLKLSMNINDINEIKTSIETKNKIETKSDFDLFNFCVSDNCIYISLPIGINVFSKKSKGLNTLLLMYNLLQS